MPACVPNLFKSEPKLDRGKITIKTKNIRAVIKSKNLSNTILYIKAITDNIKSFTKCPFGSKEYNMIASIVRSYRNNFLNLRGNLVKGDKENYYKYLDIWIDNLEKSGMINIRLTKNTSYYFCNSSGSIISVGNGLESIWKFPVNARITYKICAFSGNAPVPYFKIISIMFLNIGKELNGITLAPRSYILFFTKFEGSLTKLSDHIDDNKITDDDVNNMINSLITNLNTYKKQIKDNNKPYNLESDDEIDDIVNDLSNPLDSIEEDDDSKDINKLWIDDKSILDESKMIENK